MTEVHHASLIQTDSVTDLLIKGINSDTEVRDTYLDSFGINDARELVRIAHQRPLEKTRQTLIVRTDFITLEAQNALLKLLEESPVSTDLIFVLPKDLILLATLSSRLQVDDSYSDADHTEDTTFKEFMALDYKDRISAIEQATKQKNISWQRLIKKGLMDYLCQPALKTLPKSEIEYVARNLLTRGASNKMLLEHVALILPARLHE